MRYRIHPDTGWVHDPNTGTIYVMALPGGEPLNLNGTACDVFLDVAAGHDPIAAAQRRWAAPADEIRAGIQQFLDTLVEKNIIFTQSAAGTPSKPAETLSLPEPSDAPEPSRDYRLLYVCTANMSRSPYADITTRHLQIPGLEVRSAGTHARPGQTSMDPVMIAQLPDASWANDHVVELLTREMAESSDLIIAMSERHRDFIIDEWPDLARRTFIIGHVARELENLPPTAGPQDITPFLWQHRTADRRDSVRDPYGRGEEASQKAAGIIDSYIEPIARVLARVLMGARND